MDAFPMSRYIGNIYPEKFKRVVLKAILFQLTNGCNCIGSMLEAISKHNLEAEKLLEKWTLNHSRTVTPVQYEPDFSDAVIAVFRTELEKGSSAVGEILIPCKDKLHTGALYLFWCRKFGQQFCMDV